MLVSEEALEMLAQTNSNIQADVWKALWNEAAIRSMDLGSLSIEVKGGDVYLNGYLPHEDNLPLIESIVHSVVGVLEVHNHLRTNDGILADIWDALWKDDTIRSLDMNSISINVKDGEVYLRGHLAKEINLLLIQKIAQSIPGVVAVHNQLVLDRDLIIQVAQALDRDERTRRFFLPVSAFHGWIYLGGEVPTRELQSVAEKVAGDVDYVRGVVILPKVTGKGLEEPRRIVQPRIGASVYGENGEVGIVTKVVIKPNNRLVTHVVVRSNELKDGILVARETVVPFEAIDLVKNKGIYFQRNGPYLDSYPTLEPVEYPPAPSNWKAPYPYNAGEVLWSLPETLDAGSQPVSQPKIKPGTEIKGTTQRVTAQAGA